MKKFTLCAGAQKDLKIDYQKELNAEQLEVVLGGDGPCLVLAGAGSGKTRTITYRVAYLLEQGVPASEILLLTFTNKAANEMMSRVAGLLKSPATGLVGGTFHSMANRFLRQYASVIGYTPSFTILDQDDAQDLLKMCIKDLKVDTQAKRFPSPAVLHHLISYRRNASLDLKEAVQRKHPNFFALAHEMEQAEDFYTQRKRLSNAMDFDDLLLKLLELLETQPTIREALAKRFRYVLVDEYQDTNVIQARIIALLAAHHRNLLVVGDDAQSIYSFRAAEIKNILGFSNHYPDAKIFRLEANYRSTPEILSVANEVIRQNVDQYQKALRAMKHSADKPSLVPTSDARQEAQYIAEQIFSLREGGMPLSEIAVLFRAAYHSQALEMELTRRDVPYEYRGGMKFFERAHIKDVIAYLRLLANPKDVMAWIRILSHQPGIGLVTAGKIAEFMQQLDELHHVTTLDLSPVVGGRSESGWRGTAAILSRLLHAQPQPADFIRAVIGSSYREYLEAEYPNFMERLEDLEQFAIFAEQYSGLELFLQEVTLKDDFGAVREQESQEDEDRLVLSTIHQSKGLEWKAVFLMNLADGAFPNPRALDEDGGLEEERRLFYVAITRSQKHLFLTYPMTGVFSAAGGSAYGGDTLEFRQPSMFLDEIPKELIEEVRLKRAVQSAPRWGDDEPTIVLDSSGERREPKRIGFLRNIDEL